MGSSSSSKVKNFTADDGTSVMPGGVATQGITSKGSAASKELASGNQSAAASSPSLTQNLRKSMKNRMSMKDIKGRMSRGPWSKIRKAVNEDKKVRAPQRTKRLDPDSLQRMDALAKTTAESVHNKTTKKGDNLLKAIGKAKVATNHMLAESPIAQTLFMAIPSSTPEERDMLIQECDIRHFKKGDPVTLGSEDAFNIILNGIVSMNNWAGQQVFKRQGVIYDRELFTTTALTEDVSIFVVSQAILETLDSQVARPLKRAAAKNLVQESLESMLAFGQPSWFKELTRTQQDMFVDSLETLTLNTGDMVAERGTKAPFLLVVKGELDVVQDEEMCEVLTPSDCPKSKRQLREMKTDIRAHAKDGIGAGMTFGTKQLMDDSGVLDGSIVAVSHTIALRITQDKMENMFKQPLSKVLRTNKIIEVLKCSSVFQQLEEDSMYELCAAFTERLYTHNQVILQHGDDPKEFFVIQTGAVSVWIDNGTRRVRTLNCWDYFGERACITGDPCSATCRAEGSCLCLVLAAEHFAAIARSLRQALEDRIYLQDLQVGVTDLASTAIVARGWHGFTNCVHFRQDEFTSYAVKTIKKKQVTLKRDREALILEKQIGEDLNHKFIVSFVRTLQDRPNIYFVFEFCDGGDLFQLMRSHITFSKEAAQFYIASIVLALEYLHGCLIMHRDLRPENVLIDGNGFPKLSGFTCCRRLEAPPPFAIRPGARGTLPLATAPPPPPLDKDPRKKNDAGIPVQKAWTDEISPTSQSSKSQRNGKKTTTFSAMGKAMSRFNTRKLTQSDGSTENIESDPLKESFGNATTICGAPEYIAPEIILGNGYGFQADWWALGIISFEILVGSRPFGDVNMKHAKLFTDILSAEIAIPSTVNGDLTGPCLISRLMQRNPYVRLSSTRSSLVIENHSFFRGFDWKALAAHRMDPPMDPDITEVQDKWERQENVPLGVKEEVKRSASFGGGDDVDDGWAATLC